MPLRNYSDQISGSGNPEIILCVVLGNIPQATGVEGITISYSVANDSQYPGP